MKTPFSTEQFFEVFEKYNASVFPLQWIILLLGISCFASIIKPGLLKDRMIVAFLGLLWIWNGMVYHYIFFSPINKASYVFGTLFILQGVLFTINAFGKNRITFENSSDFQKIVGFSLIVFGLVLYPLISWFEYGFNFRIISLGLPCPSTIVTFGFLIHSTKKVSAYLLIIPTLWSVVGLSAAFNFGVVQDYMIIMAAGITILYTVFKPKARVSTKNMIE